MVQKRPEGKTPDESDLGRGEASRVFHPYDGTSTGRLARSEPEIQYLYSHPRGAGGGQDKSKLRALVEADYSALERRVMAQLSTNLTPAVEPPSTLTIDALKEVMDKIKPLPSVIVDELMPTGYIARLPNGDTVISEHAFDAIKKATALPSPYAGKQRMLDMMPPSGHHYGGLPVRRWKSPEEKARAYRHIFGIGEFKDKPFDGSLDEFERLYKEPSPI